MPRNFEFPKTHEQLQSIAKHTKREALSRSIFDMDGNALQVIEGLGGGGQMNVFRVSYNGELYALGLPHDDGFFSWEDRIKTEVESTDRVRNLGIPTHPMLEPIQLRITDAYIPGLLMYPFDALDADIRLPEEYHRSRFQYPLRGTPLSSETLPSIFGYITNEIARVANHGFRHRFTLENLADCINFSVLPDGTLHLFLSDLGTTSFDSDTPVDGKRAIGVYMLLKTLQFLGHAMPNEQYEYNQQYLRQLEKDAGVLLLSKAERVTLKEVFTLTDMVLDEIT